MAGIKKKIKYLLYRLQWKLGFLVHADIEISNVCDHACRYCFWSEKNPFPKAKMTRTQAFRYIKEARRAGFLSVKFSLRNEPTLHKDLVSCVELAKRLGFIDIMINTHGTKLKKHFIPLRDAGITTISVSVGDMDRAAYAKLHQVSVKEYDRLQESLSHVHENKGDVDVRLNCHRYEGGNFDFDELQSRFPKFKIIKRYIEERHGSDLSVKREKKRKKMCPHVKRRMTRHANGDLFPCCVSSKAPKDLNFGNDLNKALIERKKFIKEYRRGEFRPSCVNCPSGDVWTWKGGQSEW